MERRRELLRVPPVPAARLRRVAARVERPAGALAPLAGVDRLIRPLLTDRLAALDARGLGDAALDAVLRRTAPAAVAAPPGIRGVRSDDPGRAPDGPVPRVGGRARSGPASPPPSATTPPWAAPPGIRGVRSDGPGRAPEGPVPRGGGRARSGPASPPPSAPTPPWAAPAGDRPVGPARSWAVAGTTGTRRRLPEPRGARTASGADVAAPDELELGVFAARVAGGAQAIASPIGVAAGSPQLPPGGRGVAAASDAAGGARPSRPGSVTRSRAGLPPVHGPAPAAEVASGGHAPPAAHPRTGRAAREPDAPRPALGAAPEPPARVTIPARAPEEPTAAATVAPDEPADAGAAASFADAAPAAATAQTVSPGFDTASARVLPAAAPIAARGSRLADLVRRLEQGDVDRAADPARADVDPARFAWTLERVLLSEVRRHGITVEER